MKNLLFLFIALLFAANAVIAQNKSFGVGTATPNTNAALDVVSSTNNQGFLAPRLTTAFRNGMSLGVGDKGMLVFDTDLNTMFVWNGSAWGITLSGFSSTATTAVTGTNTGTGSAGLFSTTNAANPAYALSVTSNTNTVSVDAIHSVMTGTGGAAGGFIINNATNPKPSVYVETNGTGNAGTFRSVGTTNPSAALYAETNSNTNAGYFYAVNATSNYPAVYANTAGLGSALYGQTSTGISAVYGQRDGTTNGNAGAFKITNAANTWPSLYAETNGGGVAINGYTTGTQAAGYFQINNASNIYSAVAGTTNGIGTAGDFRITNASSSAATLFATTNGTGSTGFLTNTNAANNLSTLNIATNGTGPGIYSATTGTGAGGSFVVSNPSSGNFALTASSNGTGASFTAQATGTGGAAYFLNGASSATNVVNATTNGTGTVLYVNHTGASGNLALFQSGGVSKARIDKLGVGYFNGGTVNSGADVAEMFDIEGSRDSYEPGDVMVISESTDRTMEKSNEANSTKVAGVYATKPGVTLTETGIDENTDHMVPLGVIGVIPTKVCGENGAIKRGDLLVTASVKGHAMKAISKNGDGVFPSGAILGKALENFDGNGKGLIKVLVNVK